MTILKASKPIFTTIITKRADEQVTTIVTAYRNDFHKISSVRKEEIYQIAFELKKQVTECRVSMDVDIKSYQDHLNMSDPDDVIRIRKRIRNDTASLKRQIVHMIKFANKKIDSVFAAAAINDEQTQAAADEQVISKYTVSDDDLTKAADEQKIAAADGVKLPSPIQVKNSDEQSTAAADGDVKKIFISNPTLFRMIKDVHNKSIHDLTAELTSIRINHVYMYSNVDDLAFKIDQACKLSVGLYDEQVLSIKRYMGIDDNADTGYLTTNLALSNSLGRYQKHIDGAADEQIIADDDGVKFTSPIQVKNSDEQIGKPSQFVSADGILSAAADDDKRKGMKKIDDKQQKYTNYDDKWLFAYKQKKAANLAWDRSAYLILMGALWMMIGSLLVITSYGVLYS